MSNWVDVDPDDEQPTPPGIPATGSPFGGFAPVDRLAYVDDETPVELRGGTDVVGMIAAIDKPKQRQRPKPRQPQRERRWTPAEDLVPDLAPRKRIVGRITRALAALVIFGLFGAASWWLISTYQSEVAPSTVPAPSVAPSTPAQ